MNITVRSMQRNDLAAVDRVFRLAFGTEFRLPDPMQFTGDADLIEPRWQNNPQGAFVAEAAGVIVGSVTMMNWGSVAVLGPLSVRPDYWNAGLARRLLPPALRAVEAQKVRLVVLFTNAVSPRHLRLYEDFGFTSQHLIAVMSKRADPLPVQQPWLFSRQTPAAQAALLAACRQVSGAVFEGLDLTKEILTVADGRLGDTVLLRAADRIVGFAVCHIGPGSEAGSGTLSVKFGAVPSGTPAVFGDLLAAVEALASARNVDQVQVSAHHARRDAYELLKARGYRTQVLGVAMRRPGSASYDAADNLVIDEWR